MGFLSFLFRTNTKSDSINKTDEFEFTLLSPEIDGIRKSEVGEKVNFWLNPKNSNELRVYVNRTDIYEGLLGLVPSNFIKPVLDLKEKEGELNSIIKEVRSRNVLIHCGLVSLVEINEKETEYKMERGNKYISVLNKPFDPKNKVYKFTTNNKYPNHIPKDTIFNLEFKPIEDYINTPSNVCLNLISTDQKYSFEIDTYMDNVVQIIRSHIHNGYNFEVKFNNDFLPNFSVIITPKI